MPRSSPPAAAAIPTPADAASPTIATSALPPAAIPTPDTTVLNPRPVEVASRTMVTPAPAVPTPTGETESRAAATPTMVAPALSPAAASPTPAMGSPSTAPEATATPSPAVPTAGAGMTPPPTMSPTTPTISAPPSPHVGSPSQLVQAIQALGFNVNTDQEADSLLKQLAQAKATTAATSDTTSLPEREASAPAHLAAEPAVPAHAPAPPPLAAAPTHPKQVANHHQLVAIPHPPQQLPASPDRCNSSTHPREFAAFKRYCEANPGAVQNAWTKGGHAKLACFKKFVLSGCNGGAVEAVMRFTATNEVEDRDAGQYKTWTGVLDHFKNDVTKAQDLVNRRCGEPRGTVWVTKTVPIFLIADMFDPMNMFESNPVRTSTDRNTGEETFLIFGDQQRSWTTRSIEDCPQ